MNSSTKEIQSGSISSVERNGVQKPFFGKLQKWQNCCFRWVCEDSRCNLTKCWQNRLQVTFQWSMLSAQKPLLATFWSWEEWIYNGQHVAKILEIHLKKCWQNCLHSSSEVWVLNAFGTETTFSCSLELERVNVFFDWNETLRVPRICVWSVLNRFFMNFQLHKNCVVSVG